MAADFAVPLWFQTIKQSKTGIVDIYVEEWENEDKRSQLGFSGTDYLHSKHSAVRVLTYFLSTQNSRVTLHGLVQTTQAAESHRGFCHGGVMCAIMDDAIGWMGFSESGTVLPWSGFTAQINTSLRKPLPVCQFAYVEASVERQEGSRKLWINARLSSPALDRPDCEEILYCEATGLFLKNLAATLTIGSSNIAASPDAHRALTILTKKEGLFDAFHLCNHFYFNRIS